MGGRMKVIFRYPSGVPYGYVQVEKDMDDGLSPEDLGRLYVQYLAEYKAGEQHGVDAAVANKKKGRASGKEEAEPQAVDTPRSEDADPHDGAVSAVQEGLGATILEETESPAEAPWKAEAPPPKAKPWQGKKMNVANITW